MVVMGCPFWGWGLGTRSLRFQFVLFPLLRVARSSGRDQRQEELPQPLVDAELHAGGDQAERRPDLVVVVAVERRGGQPPGEGQAEGLDGEAVAAGDAAAERGQGQAGVFQAVEALALLPGWGGRGGAWRFSWRGGECGR